MVQNLNFPGVFGQKIWEDYLFSKKFDVGAPKSKKKT
jgi:hypothetical protein